MVSDGQRAPFDELKAGVNLRNRLRCLEIDVDLGGREGGGDAAYCF